MLWKFKEKAPELKTQALGSCKENKRNFCHCTGMALPVLFGPALSCGNASRKTGGTLYTRIAKSEIATLV